MCGRELTYFLQFYITQGCKELRFNLGLLVGIIAFGVARVCDHLELMAYKGLAKDYDGEEARPEWCGDKQN